MAGKIRGITIEIGGDTSGLVKSLKGADKQIASTQKQLKDVEKLLKMDPTNTELLDQKHRLLGQSVEQTKSKLEELNKAQKEMDAQGVDKNSEQYMALRREIMATENSLDDLEKAAARSNVTLSKIGAVAGEISEKAGKVSTATRGISTAAGAGLTGIVGMAMNAAAMSDDLNTLAKQTGFTTEDIQKMQYAADRIDVSMETITGSAAKMTRQLIDNEDKFTALGVATRGTDGKMRTTSEIFYDTLEALSKIENETERDTLAMDIFGRSANELAGVIDDGGAALKAYGEEMERLGLVISQETLDELNAVNDQIDKIKAQAIATLAKSGATALKALTPIIEKVVGALDAVFRKIALLNPQQIQTLMTVLAVVAAISPVAGIISKVAGAISALMPIVSALWTLLAAHPIILIIAAIVAVIAAFALFGDETKAILSDLDAWMQSVFLQDMTQIFGPDLGGAINLFLQTIYDLWAGAKGILEGLITFVQGVFSADWETAWSGITQILEALGTTFESIGQRILTAGEETLLWLGTIFVTAWTSASETITEAWGALTTWISEKWTEIKTIFEAVKSYLTETLVTAWTSAIDSIKETVTGWATLIGEKWAEIKETFTAITNYVGTTFNDAWNTAWEGIKSIFSGVFSGLAGIAEGAINGVITIINGAIDKINTLIGLINKIPGVDISTIGTIGEFSIDGAAANGGTFSRGNILVGENGPEVMTVQGGQATVTPLTGSGANHTVLGPGSLGGLSTNVNIEFSGSLAQLAHVLTPAIKAETVRVGPALVN